MTEIPFVFLKNMQRLLGDEYAAFLASLKEPPTTGLRVNISKVSPDFLRQRLPFKLEPLPWTQVGFHLPDVRSGGTQRTAGQHPYHAAGLYYIQEPSAMAVATLLDPQPGERILDLCAAPGGKATHLATLLGDRGLLVANEIHPKRVWELAKNLERWGTHNVTITNETPTRLADHLGAFFDKVLVDAPCSGEGMFRKSEAARREWSPGLIRSCAMRQSATLDEAVRLVRPGGLLAYSTCTFNPQENEAVIARLLETQKLFEIVETAVFPGWTTGCPDWVEGDGRSDVVHALRLWPHQTIGEGHFVALLRRRNLPKGELYQDHRSRETSQPNSRSNSYLLAPPTWVIQLYQEFSQENLLVDPLSRDTIVERSLSVEERLRLVGSYLYRIPEGLPDLDGLRVIHPGWWLGIIKAGKARMVDRFEPAHALAMGLQASYFKQVIDLILDDPDVLAYLRGETLRKEGKDGWGVVCVDGFPMGWGKRVRGRVKNFYPRGLRWF